jgi:SpoVK/Ycf46/Vps4 family AAA+-type ATPase
MEPDTQAIGEQQARSAILFGPPGTSKTRLARSVAGAIGWRYVELHASHFVAEGLPLVQRTANEIFERLMELDHAVILFDEIDELVRERDVEPDAFGRFLTTSMLPKLAELWEQRRVIYFIATNHIEYFDRAVTRAQRFDALVFVAPPAFERKIDELQRLIKNERPTLITTVKVTEADVNAALDALECSSSYAPDALLGRDYLLAKFILLRWDQLRELAVRITDHLPPSQTHLDITIDSLVTVLEMISDPSLQLQKSYCDFLRAARYSMKDFGKEKVWEVINLPAGSIHAAMLEEGNERTWLVTRNPESLILDEYIFKTVEGGKVLATKKAKATNRKRPKSGTKTKHSKRKSRVRR